MWYIVDIERQYFATTGLVCLTSAHSCHTQIQICSSELCKTLIWNSVYAVPVIL